MSDIGLTHVALTVADLDASVAFYAAYAGFQVVHERHDEDARSRVAWISDLTRPFVIVLLQVESPSHPLGGVNHLGVGVASREEVDRLAAKAAADDRLLLGPIDSGHPVGYWAFIRDPDGHTLEVAFGQDVGLTVQAAVADDGNG